MEPNVNLSKILVSWWKLNGRIFPWREEEDPYRIFIAETLLHRTKAVNVGHIYEGFICNFPSMKELALDNGSSIRKILEPLGLRWRTELLIIAVQNIMVDHHGRIPLQKDALTQLPGVGDYIASAIRTFAYNEREPLIDTNTVRVISRLKGLKYGDSTRRSKSIRTWYIELSNNSDPKEFGYAIIDLASIICLPKRPKCDVCPLTDLCITALQNEVNNKIP